ncbi:hypothetical protein L1049_027747 [Liquidambar formosana]|uniref:Uncharacterized protein n=1 Tax=Liquidambar formosana TaxID=63359 RepID=A0AAP0RHX3_LIQFO
MIFLSFPDYVNRDRKANDCALVSIIIMNNPFPVACCYNVETQCYFSSCLDSSFAVEFVNMIL